jgi:hypothetical protein
MASVPRAKTPKEENMHSPYQGLPPRAFWRTGVSEQNPLRITDLYLRKFEIRAEDRIVTAGSCFAQHIARKFNAYGYAVVDAEPAPPGLDDAKARDFGYGIYSARYGNIYTARQLLHLAREALGQYEPQNIAWEKGGRFYDALRPSVEPEGLASAEAVLAHRRSHLAAVRDMLATMDLFVFTFGLTEAWIDRRHGTVYPTAPGTIAGEFDPALYEFKNFTFSEVMDDFLQFRELVLGLNPGVRFLVTVSPVPLTATAGNEHVLAATTYSKSVLRAVAGELAQRFENVDYFPSYEIIASPFSRGLFYESNLRSVDSAGVENVMRIFFDAHGKIAKAAAAAAPAGAGAVRRAARLARAAKAKSKDDVVCEETLMEAFNGHA